ncbi:MAG: restriction endonuclease [Planctomycetes bacterium]|nr:restriction endonuclease [Planctomycetota bacterium]
MNDDDSIFEAERIAPQGEFRLDRLAHADPCVYGDNNSVVLAKPPKGKTLEDIRDDWDKAPRIVANAREERKPLPQVYVVNVTPVVLNQFNLDYNEIFKISPEDFELLVLDRLHAMGLCVERVGSTFARDGGIDIVFWPKPPFPMPFLAAAQVKHHRSPRRRTSVSTVREFAGVLRPPFHFGMVVTNTAFTPDAAWFASQKQGLLRLRDMYDLRRWIASDFANEAEWREMPRVVEICPGVKVQLTIGNLILPEP